MDKYLNKKVIYNNEEYIIGRRHEEKNNYYYIRNLNNGKLYLLDETNIKLLIESYDNKDYLKEKDLEDKPDYSILIDKILAGEDDILRGLTNNLIIRDITECEIKFLIKWIRTGIYNEKIDSFRKEDE